ncbi:MAG: hypothetical protein JSV96_01740 [Candidatus Aminicenantes bacterium]|nr:MAG: hypothetical protein JSV96_01740 [Candidatus Aminicenantes bacterium]
MKKTISLISLIFLLLVNGSFLSHAANSGKSIEGLWKGSLEIQGAKLRIIVKISKEADGTLKATVDSPDQEAMDIPLDNVTFENNTLRFELTSAQAKYEGKLDELGDMIEGEYSQGGSSFPLILKRSDEEAQEKLKFKIPENPFPKLKGPYPVGTHDYFWIDEGRDELLTSDPKDKRHLMVQVWYPAEKVEGAEPYPYIVNPAQYGDWKDYKIALHVKTNAVLDAPLSKKQSKYPILIYNHGGGWMRNIATFQTEMLANNGYVVFSIDHTGLNKTVVFPDGYKFVMDAIKEPEKTGNTYKDALASWEYLDSIFWSGVKDISFVIDQIEKLNNTPGNIFHGRLDMKKIGSFGWSFGGAASVQIAKDDKRVKAVLDCDGQLFGDVAQHGIDQPVMMMHGEIEAPPPDQMSTEDFEKLIKYVRERDRSFLANTKSDRYTLKIKKSQHGSFSDLMIFFQQIPNQIDKHLAHEIINAYTLAFFDRYLKGKKSPLLDQIPSKYTEVEFKKVKDN